VAKYGISSVIDYDDDLIEKMNAFTAAAESYLSLPGNNSKYRMPVRERTILYLDLVDKIVKIN
jgi:hypothetical protein